MGSFIRSNKSRFRIRKAREAEAFAALRKANLHEPVWTATRIDDAGPEDPIERARNLEEALEACGWHVERDPEGEIEQVLLEEGRACNERHLFKSLAPFVEPGSYVDIEGDDSWRFTFDGTRCSVEDIGDEDDEEADEDGDGEDDD